MPDRHKVMKRGSAAPGRILRRTAPAIVLLASLGATAVVTVPSASAEVSKTNFARCVRLHGVADFPNATITSKGTLEIVFRSGSGIAVGSPRFASALFACQLLLPSGHN